MEKKILRKIRSDISEVSERGCAAVASRWRQMGCSEMLRRHSRVQEDES